MLSCERIVVCRFFFFQAEDGIRDLVRSRGLGDVYKRQAQITDVVCVIDRSEGGTEALGAEGLTLASVVNRDDLNAAAG